MKPKVAVITKGSGSYKITLPISMIRELEWNEFTEIEIKLVGKKLTINKTEVK